MARKGQKGNGGEAVAVELREMAEKTFPGSAVFEEEPGEGIDARVEVWSTDQTDFLAKLGLH